MKECKRCHLSKPLTQFNFKSIREGRYSSYCKICSRAYIKTHYYKNKKYYLDKAKKRNHLERQKIKEYIHGYLSTHPCVDCGEKDVIVLEFDHIRGKIRNISLMVRGKVALLTIINEIDKCEVRCANCHRRKTAKQFNWFKYQT